MRTRRWITRIGTLTLVALLLISSGALAQGPAPQAALGTAFTYQGRLNDANGPVTGTCDFTFELYDEAGSGTPPTGGTLLGTETKPSVSVSEGYFKVDLDFGSGAFNGDARYLQIAVNCGSGTTTLNPRQPLTPAPYALYATRAPWSGLTDRPAGLDDGDDDTTYSAGTGLGLSSSAFNLTASYRLPQSCAGGEIAEWNESTGLWECGTDDQGGSAAAWLLTGNAGTDPATHMLGTTDPVSLTLAVNGDAALRLEPTSGTPNVIGGHISNTVNSGVYGAAIGGGGGADAGNRVTDDYGTVGGGHHNRVGDNAGSTSDASYATVGGGASNTATGKYATVGGGIINHASGESATTGGGYNNTATGDYAVVPGGRDNDITGDYSFAAGWKARVHHDGTFAWADASDEYLHSTADNQFLVRATGGVSFTTDGAPFHINGKPVYQPANMVIVAQSGGDTTSVQAAIDSITDATANNPYLVWVAPGVYNETVTMKPHVHLQGAEQEATVISSTATTGDWPPTIGTLALADHVSLRDLTVTNSGTGNHNVALLATDGTTQTLVADVTAQAYGTGGTNYGVFLTGSGTSAVLQHVTAVGEDGDENYGLYNGSGARVTLHGGSFTGRGGNSTRGIYNTDSGTMLEAKGVTALGENGSNATHGLVNSSSASAKVHSSSFTARGGNSSYGVLNSNGTLEADGVSALAESGVLYSYGLSSASSATTMLHGGSFTARGGENARGIYIKDSGTTLEAEGVTALGENANANIGLYNSVDATATVHGGSFTGHGGDYSFGIVNVSNAILEATGANGSANDGVNDTFGLYNLTASQATLHGGSFTGRGGDEAYGIYSKESGTILEAESVTALGEEGTTSTKGLYNEDAAAILHGGSFTGRGARNPRGIVNEGSNAELEAQSITVLAVLAEDSFIARYAYALLNQQDASATLHGGSFTADASNVSTSKAIGIYNLNSTILAAQRVTVVGERSSDNYGLYSFNAPATVDSSQLFGDTNQALYQQGDTVQLGVTQVDGGATRVSGTLTCFQVYDENYSAYTCP